VSNAVELDNIVKKYGGVIAVDCVSLEVEFREALKEVKHHI
jgi:ABC-type uncharacterized transport system ATPase subunit